MGYAWLQVPTFDKGTCHYNKTLGQTTSGGEATPAGGTEPSQLAEDGGQTTSVRHGAPRSTPAPVADDVGGKSHPPAARSHPTLAEDGGQTTSVRHGAPRSTPAPYQQRRGGRRHQLSLSTARSPPSYTCTSGRRRRSVKSHPPAARSHPISRGGGADDLGMARSPPSYTCPKGQTTSVGQARPPAARSPFRIGGRRPRIGTEPPAHPSPANPGAPLPTVPPPPLPRPSPLPCTLRATQPNCQGGAHAVGP